MPRSPLLFTPGPLTTRLETRPAMLNDWGSREPTFIDMTAELRRRLLDVAGGRGSHVAVPLQGSRTFIVEAAIGTLVGPADVLLVLVNGAYGERMVEIAKRLGRKVEALRWPEREPVEPATVDRALAKSPDITHVWLVHCETTSGILNPLAAVAAVVAQRRRAFIVDAMSSFGALPLDLRKTSITAVLASSNKCLEGVPGIAFALIEQDALEQVALIENSRYREGSIVSLAVQRARLEAGRPVLLMDCDVLYDQRMIARLLQAAPENALLLDQAIEPGDEPVKICLRGDMIVDFAKRPEHAHDRHGESVGFFRFSAGMAATLAERAIAYVETGRAGAEYEAVTRDLILEHPNRFGPENISDLPWTEIDFEADVARARQEILPRLQEVVHA